ncbi:MAG: glycerate kinase [Elusimicrobia bacterium CG08_land_8_20_14_0_20_59_10]|nr:MAG: glycerate kinase [Elusimicrobia bacterium CG08_land_8_20_14_0_20_59_10]
MRILIAMNAFKGTLSADAASRAAARGFKRALPGAAIDILPVADGGDGLLDVLAPVLGGRIMRGRATGPSGEALRARWLLAGRRAVIEMAEAAGLRHAARSELRPLDASTRGVGELLCAARRLGAREIFVGLGGSASNDGGAGCAQALGFELLDARGRPVAPGARGLAALARIKPGQGAAGLRGVRVFGLADVKNPLCGRLGSARVFGPQKGAGPEEAAFMEAALLNYSRVIKRDLGAEVSRLPGGAAAGGLGAGLAAFCGAALIDGSGFVLEKTGFDEKLRKADVLITGEGCFDRQTFYGKAPGAVIARARAAKKPAVVVCGRSLIRGRAALERLGVLAVVESGAYGLTAAAIERAVARSFPRVFPAGV